MSNGKHTPGPCTAEEPYHKYAEEYEIFLRGANGKLILASFAHRPTHADIRLIEAAPDLLAMLEEVAQLPVSQGCMDGPGLDPETMREVRAAIAKAKGETK